MLNSSLTASGPKRKINELTKNVRSRGKSCTIYYIVLLGLIKSWNPEIAVIFNGDRHKVQRRQHKKAE